MKVTFELFATPDSETAILWMTFALVVLTFVLVTIALAPHLRRARDVLAGLRVLVVRRPLPLVRLA
jgi:hypothetical protein